MRLRIAALATLILTFGPTFPTFAEEAPASKTQDAQEQSELPILGTFTYDRFGLATNPPVIGAVHGVHRVTGGTAVYYSVGVPDGYDAGLTSGAFTPGQNPYKPSDAAQVTLVDSANLVAYRPLATERGLVSDVRAVKAGQETLIVVYAVFPEIDGAATSVDLQFEFGATVTNVPIANVALEPTVESESTVFGQGWPLLPSAAQIAEADPQAFTYDLISRSQDIDGASSTAETTEEVEVTLDADFFFDSGSAGLSDQASTKISELASEILERGDLEVAVTGHTDSIPDEVVGNQELSENRAAAVGKALASLLDADFNISTTGLAESQPVASNSSEEGRAQNRRVTVVYQVKES